MRIPSPFLACTKMRSRAPIEVLCVAFLLTSAGSAAAREFRVVWQFPSNTYPSGALLHSVRGGFFGVTMTGGPSSSICQNGCGTVFKLTPPMTEGGSWKQDTIYSFQANGDGKNPTNGLIEDTSGTLYGTTSGDRQTPSVVYKLTPPAAEDAQWNEETLATIPVSGYGVSRTTSLMSDKAGNLYGASSQGGASSNGSVFRVSPPSTESGGWLLATLFTFSSLHDGALPIGLTPDGSGGFYGSASGGGQGYGDVFHLTPKVDGSLPWSFQTLAYAHGAYGAYPSGPINFDSDGDIMVPTSGGGGKGCSSGCGTVLEVSPSSSGGTPFIRTQLFRFDDHRSGTKPLGALLADSTGALFGTASQGGTANCYNCGTLFKLIPPTAGEQAWKVGFFEEIVKAGLMHPNGGLIADQNGALYGTSQGYNGAGVVFKFTGGSFAP